MHCFTPIFVFLFGVLFHTPWVLSSESGDSQIKYRAAVLEMVPFNNPLKGPLENVLENIRIMTEYAVLAKEERAEIMVFPEQVLTVRAPSDRLRYLKYCFTVPDPERDQGRCFADSTRTSVVNDPLNRLRCIANTTGMYIVVNVPEKVICNVYSQQDCTDGSYLYNTNIAINPSGKVIAKYRKEKTFDQPQLDKAKNENINHIFTTSFGVTFGQHIGIEVMYEQPSINDFRTQGIRDFVMPTNWIDILPFFTAPQVQSSWSHGLGVNLLAAGIHQPGVGSAGSGIYTGAYNMANSITVYNDTKGARVVVQDVVTNAPGASSSTTRVDTTSQTGTGNDKAQTVKTSEAEPTPSSDHLFLSETLEEVYDLSPNGGITTGRTYGTYNPSRARDTFEYDISYDLSGEDYYWIMLYSGVTGVGKCKWHNQVAALVFCEEEIKCGQFPFKKPIDQTIRKLNITASFEVPDIYPSIIDQNFQPVSTDHWTFSKVQNGTHTSAVISITEPIESIYAVSLIARWYDRDPECSAN